MSKFYVACDLSAESGRVMLGTLNQGSLTISEVRRFQNLPIKDKDSLQWNIPQLYQETLDGLRAIGTYEEAVDGISCDSWAADYLLFEADSSLITPTYHHRDPRTGEGMQKVLSIVPKETLYQETGVCPMPANTLFQLGAERSRRLEPGQAPLAGRRCVQLPAGRRPALRNVPGQHHAALQSGHPNLVQPAARRAGAAAASCFRRWCRRARNWGRCVRRLPRSTGLEDARVIASCSHETAAALVGLPIRPGESWAYLRLGSWAVMGTEIARPIITDASRELNFTNETGYGGAIRFSKQTVGLWILEECRRFWKEQDREIDDTLLSHLAGSAPPFESLINPADPRFLAPGDMPLKIQAFCRETRPARAAQARPDHSLCPGKPRPALPQDAPGD